MKLLDPVQVYEGDGRNPCWDCHLHGDGIGDSDGNLEGGGNGHGYPNFGVYVDGDGIGDDGNHPSDVFLDGNGKGYLRSNQNKTPGVQNL